MKKMLVALMLVISILVTPAFAFVDVEDTKYEEAEVFKNLFYVINAER